jgi:hypothetical protein
VYFEDLSSANHEGSYSKENALHVGWLNPAFEEPTIGEVPPGFIEKLKELCQYKNNWEAYRGYHACDFCSEFQGSSSETFLIPCADGVTDYYVPGMIVHYVEAHGYRPPQAFIDAVMAD